MSSTYFIFSHRVPLGRAQLTFKGLPHFPCYHLQSLLNEDRLFDRHVGETRRRSSHQSTTAPPVLPSLLPITKKRMFYPRTDTVLYNRAVPAREHPKNKGSLGRSPRPSCDRQYLVDGRIGHRTKGHQGHAWSKCPRVATIVDDRIEKAKHLPWMGRLLTYTQEGNPCRQWRSEG